MSKQAGSHFANDYNAMVERLLGVMSREDVMNLAIGGNFLPFGILQRSILLQYGLPPDGYLIDVGCGSGRTAFALSRFSGLRYLGIDVVETLLEHATVICERPDWRFAAATGLTIPEDDGVADMVCAFSLFTHLLHEESYVYLADTFRVLKPGGSIVFSFLDFAITSHWEVFQTNIERIGLPGHLNQFMDPVAIRVWAQHLGFDVVAIHGGNENYAELDEPITLEDGRTFVDRASLGQSLAILRKPGA
jgi:SAM-dependent methyltransferase